MQQESSLSPTERKYAKANQYTFPSAIGSSIMSKALDAYRLEIQRELSTIEDEFKAVETRYHELKTRYDLLKSEVAVTGGMHIAAEAVKEHPDDVVIKFQTKKPTTTSSTPVSSKKTKRNFKWHAMALEVLTEQNRFMKIDEIIYQIGVKNPKYAAVVTDKAVRARVIGNFERGTSPETQRVRTAQMVQYKNYYGLSKWVGPDGRPLPNYIGGIVAGNQGGQQPINNNPAIVGDIANVPANQYI